MAEKERKVIRGIVLRSVDTREADKILTVLTGELGKLAVKTGAWQLWEAENGRLSISTPTLQLAEGKVEPAPLEEYLKRQGRFAHLMKRPDKDAVLAELSAEIKTDLTQLLRRAE